MMSTNNKIVQSCVDFSITYTLQLHKALSVVYVSDVGNVVVFMFYYQLDGDDLVNIYIVL